MFLFFNLLNIGTLLPQFAEMVGIGNRISELYYALNEFDRNDATPKEETNPFKRRLIQNAETELDNTKPLLEEDEMLVVKRITCYTPTRKLLFSDMSFVVTKNENLLIRGPSGAGKSSILRIIGGTLNHLYIC